MLPDYQYIEEAPIDIEPREVLRLQGYRSDLTQVKENIQHLVQSQIDRGYRLIQPRAVFCTFSASLCSGGRIELEDGSEFSIGRMAKKWTGLRHLALAICTIGPDLEREVSQLFNVGDYAAAVVLDSAGSVAAESFADYVNNMICQQTLPKELSLTPRISPGYGDWVVQEQGIMFALLPGDRVGVTLTETYMMQPRKSISFAIGVGEGFSVGKGTGKCRHCNMADCPYRAV